MGLFCFSIILFNVFDHLEHNSSTQCILNHAEYQDKIIVTNYSIFTLWSSIDDSGIPVNKQ